MDTQDKDTFTSDVHIGGLDGGAGGWKFYDAQGGTEIASQVAIDGRDNVSEAIAGLKSVKRPLCIQTAGGSFYTGLDAHRWGPPIENLDHDRFLGSPEMEALLDATLTTHSQVYAPITKPLRLYVGLPQEPLSDANAKNLISNVKNWMVGPHTWQAQMGDREAMSYTVNVAEVRVTSQPVGALFDYLLDDAGAFIPERKPMYKREIGIISVGMSTVEMLVVQNGAPNQRFTQGKTAGVRRLLELLNPHGHYSRGEMDTRLRSGALKNEVAEKLPIWQGEVIGLVEDLWRNNAWERFGVVIVVGGGGILLRDALTRKFRGKVFYPDNPVLAISRGLYKFGAMQAQKTARRLADE